MDTKTVFKRQLMPYAVLLLMLVSCGRLQNDELDVMTFNIRYDNPSDGINAWPNRAQMVTDFILEGDPDLLGMQEVLWHQYTYLDSVLKGYSSVAVCRDDGMKKGEACPVFYNKKRFRELDNGTFWLSATPDVPGSIGWKAALPRITTWVRLYDRAMRDTLLYFNTHFDHISDSARIMSSAVLLGKVRELAGDNRFIITGDFNAVPGSQAISAIKEGGLVNDSFVISQTVPSGERYTFNGWGDGQSSGRIDYIFVRSGMQVRDNVTHKIIRGRTFISDHWPVTATVLPGNRR